MTRLPTFHEFAEKMRRQQSEIWPWPRFNVSEEQIRKIIREEIEANQRVAALMGRAHVERKSA